MMWQVSAITTRDLRKSFATRRGVVEAVQGVDMDVEPGEIFGFLGPNGAGKTTTLRMLTTLLPIDGGTATVAGVDVAGDPKLVRTKIGYVSQLGGSDEQATGRENLLLQGQLYGGTAAEVGHRADELMELLDLNEFADRKAVTYSGGQRRRLDIALGIVHRPEVLFLDEPSTGLDPQNRANLWGHVRQLRELGTTVFLTTHYLEEADALCDRLTIIDHGTIIATGTPHELKRQVGGDSVLLELRDAEAAGRALTLLSNDDRIREPVVDGSQLRLVATDGAELLPDLLRLLDREEIGLHSMNLSEPTLDDVFLQRTGRSLRDDMTRHAS